MGSTYTALAEYVYAPEELLDYERYEMKADEIATSVRDAKEEGREGELKKVRETATSMLEDGICQLML
ncbi:MAG: hypothetical protein LBU35_03190 [Holosporales bacterium]|jgi:hypothetical protein|nr:hypothetical protein [Holosporales bacterium]